MSKVWLITGYASSLGRNIAEAVLASDDRQQCRWARCRPAHARGHSISGALGYTANPAELIPHYRADVTFGSDSLAWLDINAVAVRKGDVVPDRPIRITFQCEYNGAFSRWALKFVEELPPGVASRALDRERDFPKHSGPRRTNTKALCSPTVVTG